MTGVQTCALPIFTEGKVGKEVKDQAINIPDVMSEPRHYGMHRHFTAAGSILMFGGGIKRGFVYGKSDKTASAPLEKPVHPTELLATIYHSIGIDPNSIVYNHLNQPRELVQGEVVTGILS